MEKSVFTRAYGLVLRELRNAREHAGLKQEEVASRLGESQSWVSKCERGERRLDVVELRAFCQAIGIPFQDFMSRIDAVLDALDDE